MKSNALEIEAESFEESVEDPSGFLSWRVLSCASALQFCLAIAACVGAAESEDGRGALTILFTIQALLLGIAAVVTHYSKIPVPLPSLKSGGELIFVCGWLFYMLVAIRLFCVENFGGNVANLNFGRDELSFAFNVDTLSHFFQGALVFFLYQDIFTGVYPMKDKRQLLLIHIEEFMALGVCGYPFYSFVKRAASEASTFGMTSHWNNVCEWSCGFAFSVCAIYPIHAFLYYICEVPRLDRARRIPTSELGRKCRLIFGGFLLIAFFGSFILLLTSWNGKSSD